MTRIRCKIEKSSFLIQASGHAGYAEVDRDIVCSAISCLLSTLAAGLEIIKDIETEIDLKDGDTTMKVKAPYWRSAQVRVMFEFVALGLEMLTNTYPENVQLRLNDVMINDRT